MGRVTDPSLALPLEPDSPRVPRTDRSTDRDHPVAVVIGGGPGGYEAALSAARHGAEVHLVESRGVGGAAVLTDVVPSKTLIATADILDVVKESGDLGIRGAAGEDPEHGTTLRVDLAAVNARVRELAAAQSADVSAALEAAGVRVHHGRGRFLEADRVQITAADDTTEIIRADVVLIATGATPRELPSAPVDGERVLTWTQLYDLEELPEHLVVVGSGVTGAEFASAYRALGSEVTLVSSRDRVLPGADTDAADVLERAFARRGVTVRSRARAEQVIREGDRVRVVLSGGEEIIASHVLMAVGAIPATDDLGLDELGLRRRESGHIVVDRVSRTNIGGVYAAGDCTGVLPLASVAAMQGRTAMAHALGEAVAPLLTRRVAQAIFTSPEIASVGVTQEDVDSGDVQARVRMIPLSSNPRAKMQGIDEGFVRVFVSLGSATVVGGVIVSPRASELIHTLALAVTHRMTADDLAAAFTVYPSMSGSVAEVARRFPQRV
ncbi:NAD(P)H-quinone dehydrogenase [Brachybacterium huguangmaarense]